MTKIKFTAAEGKRIQITNQQRREIKSMYKASLNDIKDRQEFLKNKTNISSVMRRQYLDELSKAIKDNMNDIDGKTNTIILNGMKDVADAVIKNNKDLMKMMGFPDSLVGVSNLYVPKDVVKEVMSGSLYEGKWTLSKAIWGDNEKKLKEIDYIVAKGIAENKSAYDLAKDLEKYVNPSAKKDWEWSKVYPGTRKVIDYNAQRLARTMVSHAYEESFVRVTKDNPFIEAYQWIISNSDRVCPICIERAESDEYGLGAGIYPKDKLPLDHPNGMCTFDSVLIDSMKGISDKIADWINGTGDSKLNEEIDKYANIISDGKFEKQIALSNLQKEWFEKAGYKDGEYPKDFTEFAHKLSVNDHSKLLDLAGGSWSDSHPYQKIEKFFNENMLVKENLNKKTGFTIEDLGHSKNKKKDTWYYSLPKELQEFAKQVKKQEGLTWDKFYSKYIYNGNKPIESISRGKYKQKANDFKTFISRMKKQTESQMLNLEKNAFSKMTEEQKLGISKYTGSSYKKMNKFLRLKSGGMNEVEAMNESGLTDSLLKNLKDAISALNTTKLEEEIILRRGTDLGDLAGLIGGNFNEVYTEISKVAANGTYNTFTKEGIEMLNARYKGLVGEYAGFTSTSSLYGRGFDGEVEVILKAPKGTSASSVMSISQFGTAEGETLLNAGTKVKILGIEESDGHMGSKMRMFLEIL